MEWIVQTSKSDPGTMEVRGAYLVADKLPVEDALLIAAAPEMFDALEDLLIYGRTDAEHVIAKAKAALAKARGEQQ